MSLSCGLQVSRIIQSQSNWNKKAAVIGFRTLLLNQNCFDRTASISAANDYHTSPNLYAGQEWRRKQGLPSNPNAYGPLTDGPDYSFIDGRPTPPGSGKIKRALAQREIAAKIIELSNEVDFAVEFHQQKQVNEQKAKTAFLERKLKPKGNLPS